MLFDENDLLEAMNKISEEETDQLLGLILDFLKSYDKESDKNLLLLAEKLIRDLLKNFIMLRSQESLKRTNAHYVEQLLQI